ncbi:zinc transporter ZntB [Sphingomonas bacterium]|uniref:zinc transporter ZntB n=1 Tax=Sphingomonas bacterium TaxID=1895847 RepID=UPI001576B20F|nr:zinc transporter ZntB [Sphingomonas bacterium]
MSGFGYRIVDGHAERVEVKDALACDGGLAWVHLSTNNEEAQGWLAGEAALDSYVVDALTATETRPRCEQVGDGALLNMRGRSSEELDSSDLLASVRIWGTKGRVFSVTRKDMVAVDAVSRAVEAGGVRDPGDLITAFATAITEDLDPEVAQLGDDLDECEEQLNADRVFELRRTVTRVRVAAIGYRRFLAPQRAALEKLAALPGDWLQADDRLHIAAAADRAARMAEELESIRERSALIHETLTDLRAEQIDSRSLVIAIVAMVFLPLTFVTGVYGMNVKDLPYADRPWSFDAIMALCVVIAAGITGYFLRRHWLRAS